MSHQIAAKWTGTDGQQREVVTRKLRSDTDAAFIARHLADLSPELIEAPTAAQAAGVARSYDTVAEAVSATDWAALDGRFVLVGGPQGGLFTVDAAASGTADNRNTYDVGGGAQITRVGSFVPRKEEFADQDPATAGSTDDYGVGDVVWSTDPATTGVGWVCSVAGSPGTWIALGTGPAGADGADGADGVLVSATADNSDAYRTAFDRWQDRLANAGHGKPKAAVVVLVGQSLNAGRGGSVVKGTTAEAYMPVGGAHVSAMDFWSTNEEFCPDWAELASASTLAEGGEGQSPCVGIASTLIGSTFARVYVGSAAVGARNIGQLSAGGPRASVYAFTHRLCSLARAAGYDPFVMFSYRHGEADAGIGTSEADYQERALAYMQMMQLCGRQAMEKPRACVPIVATMPVQGSNDAADRAIKSALLGLVGQIPDLLLRGGSYDVPVDTDLVHPTPAGYVLMGEADGLALRKFWDDSVTSGRVQIVDATWDGGTEAVVVFSENVARDASDNVGSALAGTDGFEWLDNGSAVAISAISYSGRTATLTLGATPSGTVSQQVVRIATQDNTPTATSPANVSGSVVRRNEDGESSIFQPTFIHRHWATPQVFSSVRSA